MSDEPCRPFSPDRKGISLGEAAGFALLSKEPAEIRLRGVGESCDAYHMSSAHPDGLGARLSMQRALQAADMDLSDVDYVNLHGTGTRANDETEGKVCADMTSGKTLYSATKGWTGHTLGPGRHRRGGIVDERHTHGFRTRDDEYDNRRTRAGCPVAKHHRRGRHRTVKFFRLRRQQLFRGVCQGMRVSIQGLGIWTRGLTSYADLSQAVRVGHLPADAAFAAPKPEAIPARERRRAGLMINLAVTVAHQACEHRAPISPRCLRYSYPAWAIPTSLITCAANWPNRKNCCPPPSFTTPYTTRLRDTGPSARKTTRPALSRARAITASAPDCWRRPALVEAGAPAVLLVAYDIANTEPFSQVSPISESFGSALIIAGANSTASGTALAVDADVISTPSVLSPEHGNANTPAQIPDLAAMAANNPSAASLGLLEQIVRVHEGVSPQAQVCVSATPRLSLQVNLCASAQRQCPA